ncbi:sensor histidine kinase [Sphingopyxis sp. P1IMeth2]|uniref:sensor histidine kinase n=1 Tax=Sphingopyxis sp. P1IMeth2 TaxID=1892848 RepID=UPI0016444F16|nr:histidine kinase [Sphingopyxis sp. P1IMeth2]
MQDRSFIACAAASPAARVSLILWGFGFALVAILAGLMGRGFLVQAMIQLPLCLTALSLAMALFFLWQRLEPAAPALRWPSILVGCLCAGALQSALDLVLYRWLTDTLFPEWQSWTNIDFRRIGFVFILYTWTFCLNVTLFWALGISERAKKQEMLAAAAEARAQDARIEALRFQLNPHFLLNTLNAISSLIVQGRPDDADAMTMKLATFFQINLGGDVKTPIALADEIATIEAYLDMEAIRFAERLKVEIDCPADLGNASVPGFILQPLVENAVKYAVASSRLGATISIVARAADDMLTICVSDDGRAELPVPENGTGVGLRNIRDRLAVLYGERGQLHTSASESGFTATLHIPLMPCQARGSRALMQVTARNPSSGRRAVGGRS